MRDYSVKLSAGYTVVASLMAFLAQSLYRDFFDSVLKLASSEEYSYIIVSFFTVLVVVYLSIRSVGLSYSIRVSKVLASASLASLALLAHFLSEFSLEFQTHLRGLSFAFLFVSTMVLVYDPASPAHLIPMLTVFLLVPLPASVVDSVTPPLSRAVGGLVAAVTGSRLVETPGYVALEVSTPGGAQLLSVEAACTGIVTLSSVVAVVPVLVFLVSMGRAGVRRKVLASAAAAASALAVGFLGNLVRVLLVVYAASGAGLETAMRIFHYSPSAVYSSISVALAFFIALRYGGVELTGEPRASKSLDVSWSYALGVLALALAMVLAASSAILAVEGSIAAGGRRGLSITARDFESLLENPTAYFTAEGVSYLDALYDSYLTRVLGALAAYRITMGFSGSMYRGYLELVDTPARLHTWQLCLAVQGYEVTRSWSRSYGTLQVSYIVAEAAGRRYLLAYTIVPVKVRTGAADHELFARISVLTPFDDLVEAVEGSTRLVMAVVGGDVEGVELKTETLGLVHAVSCASLATLAAYLLLVSARHVYHSLRARSASPIRGTKR